MRLAAVSTVIRGVPVGQPTGYLNLVDLDEQQVIYRGAAPLSVHRPDDPNPRGGTRGVKGVSACERLLAVAVSDRVLAFDRSWRLVAELTHRWFGQLHGILADAGGVWVAATACDMLIRLDWRGTITESWSWREDQPLRRALGVGRLASFDPDRDYRDPLATGASFNAVHLNAIARWREGLLLSFGQVRSPRTLRRHRREQMLVRLLEASTATRPLLRRLRARRLARPPGHGPDGRPNPEHAYALVELRRMAGEPRPRGRVILHHNAVGVPNHDVAQDGDLIAYNDTNANDLIAVDESGDERCKVRLPGRPGFARGLASLGDGLFLSGNQDPAAVHLVDLGAGRLVSSIPVSGTRGEAVSAIALLPGGFRRPARLPGFEPETPLPGGA